MQGWMKMVFMERKPRLPSKNSKSYILKFVVLQMEFVGKIPGEPYYINGRTSI